MPSLTKKIGFSASHFYWCDDFSESENWEIFGSCANKAGHGHNYQVEVTLAGTLCEQTGMIINFFDLDPLLQSVIVQPLDHQNLNLQVPYFQSRVPTLENIALYIWKQLAPEIEARNLALQTLKVIENHDLYVEYDGAAA